VAPFVFEDYLILQPFLRGTEKMVVFLVSHAVQYARSPYERAGSRPPAGLVLCDPGQELDLTGTALDALPRTIFPLCLDLSLLPPAHEVPERPAHIAIFSRMEPDKPLDFFFYSLQGLLRQASVMLHVFGRGDKGAYAHLLELLGITKYVRFEGHAPDMHDAIRLHQIAVVWGHSIGSFFGYSTLQLASAGVPLILWNMGARSSPEAWVPTYASVPEFTNHTALLLRSHDRLAAHGAQLREEILARRDIRHRIHGLEAFLESLVAHPNPMGGALRSGTLS
jgi:glycosyltransferase involved in cell wall biosynthesis